MTEYLPVLEALKIPAQAGLILKGEIVLPEWVNGEQPPSALGYPPALIPLWLQRDGPSYTGLWCHWFTPSRKPTYVESGLENGFDIEEYARNLTQLAIRVVGSRDGFNATAATFLGHFGLTIEDFPADLDDSCEGLEHPAFDVDYPSLYSRVEDPGYTGDFPRKDLALTEEVARGICGHELILLPDLGRKILAEPYAPAWLTTDRPDRVFDSLLDGGDLQGAWMALNTPPWSIAAMRDALDRLAATAGDPTFRLLADAWIAQDHAPNVFGGSIDPRHVMDRD